MPQGGGSSEIEMSAAGGVFPDIVLTLVHRGLFGEMVGLYLVLIFRIGFVSACVGVVLFVSLAYLQKKGRPISKTLLVALTATKVLTSTIWCLVFLLGFWPFDPSLLNDFFLRTNRVLHIF